MPRGTLGSDHSEENVDASWQLYCPEIEKSTEPKVKLAQYCPVTDLRRAVGGQFYPFWIEQLCHTVLRGTQECLSGPGLGLAGSAGRASLITLNNYR